MTLVVNLFGAPGSGKSTTAAHVFALLKYRGINCELVQEYAKELCWQGVLRQHSQEDIFKEQRKRVCRLLGKVDVVITDSPSELSYIYAQENGDSKYTASRYFKSIDRMYTNTKHKRFNVGVCRVKPYNPKGREQSEIEAEALAEKILYEPKFDIHLHINGSPEGVECLLNYILDELGLLDE